MKKLSTLVIDDEPDAVDFIVSVIGEYCPDLEVAGTANNVKQGIQIINNNKPDLIFLDVEMPNGTGFDLLSNFPDKNFDVIFVTAFNHYAIKAIKFSALDYILKPINISEFIESVNKVVQKHNFQDESLRISFDALLENLKTGCPTRLVIPTSDGKEYIDPKTIIRIEADRSYTWFYTKDNRKVLVSRHLKEFQDLLDERFFFRPHNSHLINLEYVKKFIRQDGGCIVMCDGSQVPVSRNRKDIFLSQMSKYSRNT